MAEGACVAELEGGVTCVHLRLELRWYVRWVGVGVVEAQSITTREHHWSGGVIAESSRSSAQMCLRIFQAIWIAHAILLLHLPLETLGSTLSGT